MSNLVLSAPLKGWIAPLDETPDAVFAERMLGDGLAIDPSATTLHGARVDTHHDHRLAMAFAVLGAAIGSVEIVEPQVVTKSWPGFWEMLAMFERNR